MSYADETKARAYLREVTGVEPGRLISSFEHRIEFELPVGASRHGMRVLLRSVLPQVVEQSPIGGDEPCRFAFDYGKRVFIGAQSFGLQQVCEPSGDLQNAIHATWQAIAEEGMDVRDNADAIELCLDADRLTMFGDELGETADKELSALTAMFGYAKVDKVLAAEVRLI